LAEIELKDEGETFLIPEWISTEVSHDLEYFNARLIDRC
jgi:adenylate cyclase